MGWGEEGVSLKPLVPAKKSMASSKTAAHRTNSKCVLRMGALEGVLATAGDTFLRRGDGVYTGREESGKMPPFSRLLPSPVTQL